MRLWLSTQVPTPAPTRVPDFELNVQVASAALIFVAFAQAAICVGLFLKSQKRSRDKSLARGDAALTKEQNKFTAAHIVDLFGAIGDRGNRSDLNGAGNDGDGSGIGQFTPIMVSRMFNALDGDGDALITKDNLEEWILEQRAAAKAGGFDGYFEDAEVRKIFALVLVLQPAISLMTALPGDTLKMSLHTQKNNQYFG